MHALEQAETLCDQFRDDTDTGAALFPIRGGAFTQRHHQHIFPNAFEPVFAAVNVQGGITTSFAFDKLWHALTDINPDLLAAYVAELDHRSTGRHLSISNYLHRHWPGQGSWSMAWAVDPKIARYLESEQWLGRCGSLHLKLPTCDVEDTDNIFIDYFLVGVHAPHDKRLLSGIHGESSGHCRLSS